MVTMNMMKVTIDQVVNVVAMRDRFVAAARPVDMVGLVTIAPVFRCTHIWVRI